MSDLNIIVRPIFDDPKHADIFFKNEGFIHFRLSTYDDYFLLSFSRRNQEEALSFVKQINGRYINGKTLSVSIDNLDKVDDSRQERSYGDREYRNLPPTPPPSYSDDPRQDRSYGDRDYRNPPPPPSYEDRSYRDRDSRNTSYQDDFSSYGDRDRGYSQYSDDRIREDERTRTIRVSGYPKETLSDRTLFNDFWKAGIIRHMECRGGDGFLEFNSEEEASEAIKMCSDRSDLKAEYIPNRVLGLPKILIPLVVLDEKGQILDEIP